jgi:hypothetical protein
METAYAAFTEELDLYQAIGNEWGTASAQGNLAEVALRLGDTSAAARHQSASLELAVAQGSTTMVAFSLIVAARLAGLREDWPTACRLHAQGETLLAQTGLELYEDDRRESDELLAGARHVLGDEAFDRWVDDGRSLEVPEAVDLARTLFAHAEGQTA